ncbi:MAG: ATP-binding cassette domain-containing protein [Anaeroplasma sp.]
MLYINNIKKKYKNHLILNNITLKIDKPGLYILQGVNGCGKSTLLKILGKIIYKSDGKIENDFKIAYLPDKFSLPKLMNVKSYLSHLTCLDIDNLLARYQIPNMRIEKLSKGNYQKLGILQVLSFDADCYLLDEPLDGLDDFAKKLFKTIISEKIDGGKLIIMSLHNKNLFNELRPTVYIIKDGCINEKRKKE